MKARRSRTRPSVDGYCTSAPNTLVLKSNESGSPTTTRHPSGSARVRTTSMVCGWQSLATKNALASPPFTACTRLIASAAAVPSSSKDAFATGRPVRSITIVW